MGMKPVLFCDDGSERELPFVWEICSHCEGGGTDRGASVECDGGGITASEAAELGDDFMEDYRRGFYDKPCGECEGTGKVQVVDFKKLSKPDQQAWNQQVRDERDDRAVERMERMMGA